MQLNVVADYYYLKMAEMPKKLCPEDYQQKLTSLRLLISIHEFMTIQKGKTFIFEKGNHANADIIQKLFFTNAQDLLYVPCM